jgi:hypothetical protein
MAFDLGVTAFSRLLFSSIYARGAYISHKEIETFPTVHQREYAINATNASLYFATISNSTTHTSYLKHP